MRKIILKIDPLCIYLTPLHHLFLELCIVSGNYKAALPILTCFPIELDPESSSVEGIDVRKYLYYAGIAWIGNHKFKEAVQSFKLCVEAPAKACSAIVIAAYKKYLLSSLIFEGKVQILSKKFIPAFQKHATEYAHYDQIALDFDSNNPKLLYDSIISNKEKLDRDHNYGLAKQVFQSLELKIIQSLSKSFLTLSLENIGERLMFSDQTQEIQAYILSCIKTGKIKASISQQQSMVTFSLSEDSTDTTFENLNNRLENFISFSSQLENANRNMTLDVKVLEKSLGLNIISTRSEMDSDELFY